MPHHDLRLLDDLVDLVDLVGRGGVLVLSGAGISTESGIPDYRGATGTVQRTYTPMTYETYRNDPTARRRYWARGFLGWQHMQATRPNRGHLAVAALEDRGYLTGIITQNVDGLHTAAGSHEVIDLHGRLDRIICLGCGRLSPRADVQSRLAAANPDWEGVAVAFNPDGDAEIAGHRLDDFEVVDCQSCGGLLKPDVVYFGEAVPPERVDAAFAMVSRARCVLVLGSSLSVFSGRRFVTEAFKRGLPIAIVNEGPTRCDDIATLKFETALGTALPHLLSHLPSP